MEITKKYGADFVCITDARIGFFKMTLINYFDNGGQAGFYSAGTFVESDFNREKHSSNTRMISISNGSNTRKIYRARFRIRG